MGKILFLRHLKANRDINKICDGRRVPGRADAADYKLAKEMNVLVQFVPKKKIDQMAEGNHQGVVAQVAAYQYAEIEDLFNDSAKKGEPHSFYFR